MLAPFRELRTRFRARLEQAAEAQISEMHGLGPDDGSWKYKFVRACAAWLGVPLIIAIKLIRPIIDIRYNLIFAERIGHFPIDCELYLIEKQNRGRSFPLRVNLFYFYPPYCNTQLVRMYRRVFRDHAIASALYFCDRRFFGGKGPFATMHGRDVLESRDEERLFERTPRFLNFTAEEEEFGRDEITRIGLDPEQPFVLFHNRDPAYLRSWANWDTSYHDFRDCSIANFIPAMETMVGRGYRAVRYGYRMQERLDHQNRQIVDYATHHRTEFLDIYLLDKCRFFVGNTAGPIMLAAVLRKPSVCTNFIPISHTHTWRGDSRFYDLFIPKRLWSKPQNRLLSLREMQQNGSHALHRIEEYDRLGIIAIENTAEEIQEVTEEMEQRINGTWIDSAEDEALQRRFWDILKPQQPGYQSGTRIGTGFLRRHPDFLA
jgi:putative glycosyltransferase (TIGR04372 family)